MPYNPVGPSVKWDLNEEFNEVYAETWQLEYDADVPPAWRIRYKYTYLPDTTGGDRVPGNVLVIEATPNGLNRWLGTNPSWQTLMSNISNRSSVFSVGRRVSAMTNPDTVYGENNLQRLEEFCKAAYQLITQGFDHCPACATWGHSADENHPLCDGCGTQLPVDARPFAWTECYQHSNGYIHTNREFFCDSCTNSGLDDLFRCSYCYNWHHTDEFAGEAPSGDPLCDQCYEENIAFCGGCGSGPHYTGDLSWHTWQEQHLCSGCYRDTDEINSWDYRPDLIFHPHYPTDPKKPLYIGMELECSFRNSDAMYQPWSDRFDPDLIYIKEDSSVYNGFEFVTHPMEPRWALENFPFNGFQELIDQRMVHPTHSSAGTHIHMNKEAFSTSHLWKFMQIHFRLGHFCETVGGRDASEWGSFTHSDLTVQRKRLKEIVKRKGESNSDYARYVAVNLRNEYTIELRYPAGDVTPEGIKKNIQWALALYEFSDYLSITDVREGALDDPGYLLWWINEGDYPDLAKYISTKFPIPTPLAERTN